MRVQMRPCDAAAAERPDAGDGAEQRRFAEAGPADDEIEWPPLSAQICGSSSSSAPSGSATFTSRMRTRRTCTSSRRQPDVERGARGAEARSKAASRSTVARHGSEAG